MTSPETRLRELGYELPPAPQPAGSYVPATRAGTLLFTAGQVPLQGGELAKTGKVGDAVTLEEAQEAARLCALNALAAAAAEVGGLNNISRIVKVTGFVASAEGFNGQPQVLNGASDLLGDVLG
jgi:enamine deaminase RidA (YjgF/YER057c/UK114 family)